MEKLANISAFESLQSSSSSAVIYNGKIKDKIFDWTTQENPQTKGLSLYIKDLEQEMDNIAAELDDLRAMQDRDYGYERENQIRILSAQHDRLMAQIKDALREKEALFEERESLRTDYDKSPVGYTAGVLAGLLRKTLSPKIEAFKRGFSK